eukprot:2441771-Prymnesium_polylepis.1
MLPHTWRWSLTPDGQISVQHVCCTCVHQQHQPGPTRERHDELVWRVLGRGHWCARPVCAWSHGWHPLVWRCDVSRA